MLARCVVSGFSFLVRRTLIPAGAQEVYSFSLSYDAFRFFSRLHNLVKAQLQC